MTTSFPLRTSCACHGMVDPNEGPWDRGCDWLRMAGGHQRDLAACRAVRARVGAGDGVDTAVCSHDRRGNHRDPSVAASSARASGGARRTCTTPACAPAAEVALDVGDPSRFNLNNPVVHLREISADASRRFELTAFTFHAREVASESPHQVGWSTSLTTHLLPGLLDPRINDANRILWPWIAGG